MKRPMWHRSILVIFTVESYVVAERAEICTQFYVLVVSKIHTHKHTVTQLHTNYKTQLKAKCMAIECIK